MSKASAGSIPDIERRFEAFVRTAHQPDAAMDRREWRRIATALKVHDRAIKKRERSASKPGAATARPSSQSVGGGAATTRPSSKPTVGGASTNRASAKTKRR